MKKKDRALLLIAGSVLLAVGTMQNFQLNAIVYGCYNGEDLSCMENEVNGWCTWEPPNNCACALDDGNGNTIWVDTYFCQV